MATFFGSSSTPSDNGTNTNNPTVITPVASMQEGDLCYLIACGANTSGTISMSETGGQTWTALTQVNQSRNRTRSFWCRFNGTWSANPSVTMTGTANNIVRMLVFRSGSYGTAAQWYVDVAFSGATYAAPSTPYTVTIPSVTVVTEGAMVIATWTSADDNTWDSLSGSGWTQVTSPSQVRNTSGSYDQSIANAYRSSGVGGTGTVSLNQATLGGDAGTRHTIAFIEYQMHSAVGTSAAASSTDSPKAVAKVTRAVSGACAAQSTATATGYPLKFASGSSAAQTSTSATAINADKVIGFYNWLLKDVAVGGVAGPKVEEGTRITEVSSYVVGGTSAAFNIEERSSPESAGTNLLSSDQTADADGTSTTTINNSDIAADNTLYLDISAVTGDVTHLSVTAAYYRRISRIVTAAASCAASTATSAVAVVGRACVAAVASVTQTLARAYMLLAVAGTCSAITTTSAGVSGTAIVTAAGSSAAVTTTAATATLHNKVFGVYNWLIGTPVVGGIAGPEIAQDCRVTEVSSYVTAATSVTFNVEERTSPESAGTNLLSADQVASTSGTSTTTIANPYLNDGNTLWLDISAVSGTPGNLSVSVKYFYYITTPSSNAQGSSSASTSTIAVPFVVYGASGSSSASTSATASATVGVNIRKGFFNWTVKNLETARVPGPKIPEDAIITEVSGYIVGGTSASFNIEQREDPSVIGPQLLTDDLYVGTSGALTTSFSTDTLLNDRTLFLYIRSLSGSPTYLSVTIHTEPGIIARATSRAVTSATASAYKELGAAGLSAARFGCTGDFVRARFVTAQAASSGAASASGYVTIVLAGAASSAASTSTSASASVTRAGFTATATASTATAAVATVTRYAIGASAASTTATAQAYTGIGSLRATSAAVTHATATADFKNKARGWSAASTSATAIPSLLTPSPGATSSAMTTATAKITYTPGLLKGSSAAVTTATATADAYGPAQLWGKINGEWRMLANGVFV
jgi:hypothetical protein